MKNNQIKHLMRKYSTIVVVSFVIFVLAILVQTMISSYSSATKIMEHISMLTYEKFNTDYRIVTDISHDMVSTEAKINSYDKLLNLSFGEYRTESLLSSIGSEIPYLPSYIENYVRFNQNIDMLIVEIVGNDIVYVATASHPNGTKLNEMPTPTSNYKIEKDLINIYEFEVIGKVTFYLEDEDFTNVNTLLDQNNNFRTYILDSKDQLMYASSGDTRLFDSYSSEAKEGQSFSNYISKRGFAYSQIKASSDYKIVTFAPEYTLYLMASKGSLIWLFLALGMVSILLFTFRKLFKNYEEQVDDVVASINRIKIETIAERIDLSNKDGEFLLISKTINSMLEDMEKYIDEIYMLELRQKEAELSALQAQINPHFMYNTLEYIRMNVLSEGLKDLSDVVFSFASLLRNNISSVKTIQLKNELDFCEKYVFLYQIRHPNHIAYSFNISQEAGDMIVPRFILQPLIENYLIHGLDYERIDNAISVYAYREEDTFIIRVADNGKGMDDEALYDLQEALRNHDKTYRKDSIGIMNVNDRLKYFYEGKASMEVYKNNLRGITVLIKVEIDS